MRRDLVEYCFEFARIDAVSLHHSLHDGIRQHVLPSVVHDDASSCRTPIDLACISEIEILEGVDTRIASD